MPRRSLECWLLKISPGLVVPDPFALLKRTWTVRVEVWFLSDHQFAALLMVTVLIPNRIDHHSEICCILSTILYCIYSHIVTSCRHIHIGYFRINIGYCRIDTVACLSHSMTFRATVQPCQKVFTAKLTRNSKSIFAQHSPFLQIRYALVMSLKYLLQG